MTLQEAEALLNTLRRYELKDHAFGVVMVSWHSEDGKMVAEGDFRGSDRSVFFHDDRIRFRGNEAQKLRFCGLVGKIERNDSGFAL